MEIELAPPRYIPVAGRAGRVAWSPWVEVAVRVRARVAAWSWRDEAWLHWALPASGGLGVEQARRFDPGRRAAMMGKPAGARLPAPSLDADGARALAARLLAKWAPVVHHADRQGITSRLDEGPDPFRRRCLSLLGPAIQTGRLTGAAGAAEVASLLSDVQSRRLRADEIEVVRARVGVGWYPDKVEPLVADGDLLIAGRARGGR